MNNTQWVLIDTETTGFSPPIFVVELAAQYMQGWEPVGPPFRKLLNQNKEIPNEASRVHGYTREVLERDGEMADKVYREFADYVGKSPIVAYNLQYDLDDVLIPEWKRLGISPIGIGGFCALRLAQRLLDPVPAGNCKLQTLRQYYRLPERGAHTALGDVQTVADLMSRVLRPIAESKGLFTWESLCEYSSADWFPSRIAFGRHKGRRFDEAREDRGFYNWLEWLSASSSRRNAKMGQWYLRQLEIISTSEEAMVVTAPDFTSDLGHKKSAKFIHTGLMVFVNPELEELRQLVASGRSRLADLESSYTKEKSRVDLVQANLFSKLRSYYQERDRLILIVDFRRRFINALVRSGEDQATQEESNYEQARSKSDQDYDDVSASVAEKTRLTPEQEAELSQLWRKLVKLYHPDRVVNQPEKLATYDKLTMAINKAKGSGDTETLRAIADNPEGFILSQGWEIVDLCDSSEITTLRRLHELLQLDIIDLIETINHMHASSDFELCQLVEQQPDFLDEIVKESKNRLESESKNLKTEAAILAKEIEELTGRAPERIF